MHDKARKEMLLFFLANGNNEEINTINRIQVLNWDLNLHP